MTAEQKEVFEKATAVNQILDIRYWFGAHDIHEQTGGSKTAIEKQLRSLAQVGLLEQK